jgi:hypothetical protein
VTSRLLSPAQACSRLGSRRWTCILRERLSPAACVCLTQSPLCLGLLASVRHPSSAARGSQLELESNLAPPSPKALSSLCSC